MKIDDLNLKDISLKKGIDFDIDITLDLLSDFNKRRFNPKNINEIIKLCNLLGVDNLQNFIIKYTIPTKDLYKISDENKELVTLPEFMITDNLVIYDQKYHIQMDEYRFNMICYEASKLGLNRWIKWGNKWDYGWTNYIDDKKDNLFIQAIENGHLSTLKLLNKLYLLERGKNLPWDESTTDIAAKFGRINILKYLNDNKCPIDRTAFTYSVNEDKINSLKYLHKLKGDIYFPCDIMESAVINDSIKCIKYLDEINIKSPWYLLETCVSHNSINCLKYIISKNWFVKKDIAADILFRNNDRFEEEYLDPLKRKLIEICIKNNYLESLKYLIENENIVIDNKTIRSITGFKGRDCIRYLEDKKLITRNSFSFF